MSSGSDEESPHAGPADLLSSEGFVLLDQLCGSDLIEHALRVCSDRTRAAQQALGEREIGIGSAAGYEEIVQRSPGRWDVPIAPDEFGFDDRTTPWWPLVAGVLGEDAEHSYSGAISSEPNSPDQYWHTDSPHVAAEHRAAHAINVLVALHDIPMTMGPTEFARGSHRLTNHLSNPSLVREELIYQNADTSPESVVRGTQHPVPEAFSTEMPAGACLIFDDRVLHRGLSNRSDHTRHVAYFTYRRRGYSENTYFESPRSVFDATA